MNTKEFIDRIGLLPDVLRTRGRGNTIHDINRAADLLDEARAALSTLPIAGEGKDDAEALVENFEKAFFSRCLAETGARKKAYLEARGDLISRLSLSSPGKDGGQEVEAVASANLAEKIIRQARRVIAAENKHLGSVDGQRLDIDFEHAALTDFSTADCDNALRIVQRRRRDAHPASTALVERLQMALERLITAIEREPVVGDLDYPHAHNDWLGWRKKILRPTASAAKAVLSASQSTSREGESR